MAEVSLYARLVGRGLGIPPKEVDRQLDLFALELYEDIYRPSIIETLRELQQIRKNRVDADQEMLKKLDRMTVDVPEPVKKKPKRRV